MIEVPDEVAFKRIIAKNYPEYSLIAEMEGEDRHVDKMARLILNEQLDFSEEAKFNFMKDAIEHILDMKFTNDNVLAQKLFFTRLAEIQMEMEGHGQAWLLRGLRRG